MGLKEKLKKNKYASSLYYFVYSMKDFFLFNVIGLVKGVTWFLSDYFELKRQLSLNNNAAKIDAFCPQLNDKTSITPIEPIYFFQDAWAAKKIFELKPEHHYDVGSAAKTIAIISQFVPTTMVDIRPLELNLENLYFKKGSILNLPFEDNSIKSISSLCVIEHIGLGRYGDPIDILGSEKAVKELIRVTAPGGIILLSVPVGNANKVLFNAHRIFDKDYLMKLFYSCELIEDKYILRQQFNRKITITDEFQVGLFKFKKL